MIDLPLVYRQRDVFSWRCGNVATDAEVDLEDDFDVCLLSPLDETSYPVVRLGPWVEVVDFMCPVADDTSDDSRQPI